LISCGLVPVKFARSVPDRNNFLVEKVEKVERVEIASVSTF